MNNNSIVDYVVRRKYPYQFESFDIGEVHSQIAEHIQKRMILIGERTAKSYCDAIQRACSAQGAKSFETRVRLSQKDSAKSFIDGNVACIEISTGKILLLALMNYATLSFIDESQQAVDGVGSNKEGWDSFHPIFHTIINSILFHQYPILDGVSFSVMKNRPPRAFLKTIGLSDPLFDASLSLALDHQFEFVFLHELYHLAFGTNSHNASEIWQEELAADAFAHKSIIESWSDSAASHTSFCEFSLFSMFVYLDFMEFFNAAVWRGLNMSLTKFETAKPSTVALHPPSIDRFRNICATGCTSSQFNLLFLQLAEECFLAVTRSLVLNRSDLTKVRQHIRIMAGELPRNMMFLEHPKLVEMEVGVALFDSADLLPIGKVLPSEMFFPDHLSTNSWGHSIDDLESLCESRGRRFASVANKAFGEVDTNRLSREIASGLVMRRS